MAITPFLAVVTSSLKMKKSEGSAKNAAKHMVLPNNLELTCKPEGKQRPCTKIMRENNISTKVTKKYKATTNSKYDLPVADNILNRDSTARKPNQKWVFNITYIPTKEG